MSGINMTVVLALCAASVASDMTTALTPCAAPEVEAAGELPEWVHIVPVGVFRGHPSGDFQVDAEVMNNIINNFERDQIRLVLDLDHQTLRCRDNGMPAPAAGWFDKLEARADGIWAHVEMFTEKGATLLRATEYRYISPVICWWREDKSTGQVRGAWLHSVALCNRPWFAGELRPPMGATDVQEIVAAEVAKLQRTAADTQAADALVEQLVREGRITPAAREAVLTLARNDIKAVRTAFAGAAPVVPLAPVVIPDATKAAKSVTATEAAVFKQIGVTPEQVQQVSQKEVR